jgi:diguanylate cyclase (GGDEF)-like protein/PAS domain S-box-containing protein
MGDGLKQTPFVTQVTEQLRRTLPLLGILAVVTALTGSAAVAPVIEANARIERTQASLAILHTYVRMIAVLREAQAIRDRLALEPHRSAANARAYASLVPTLDAIEENRDFLSLSAASRYRWAEFAAAVSGAARRSSRLAPAVIVSRAEHAVDEASIDIALDADSDVSVHARARLVTHTLPDLVDALSDDHPAIIAALRRPHLSNATRLALAGLIGAHERLRAAVERDIYLLRAERTRGETPALLTSADLGERAVAGYDTAVRQKLVRNRPDRFAPAIATRELHAVFSQFDPLFTGTVEQLDDILTARIDALDRTRNLRIWAMLLIVFGGTAFVIVTGAEMARGDREALKIARMKTDTLTSEIERLRFERALRVTEAQFHSVFENARVGIALFDKRGDLIDGNSALRTMLNADKERILTSLHQRIVPFLERQREADHDEELVRRRDVRTLWLDLSICGVYEGGQCELVILLLQDITERKQLESRLTHDANHDSLTRLANRAAFERALESALIEAKKFRPFALLLIDLDYFKEVNDTYGHSAGDLVLVTIADRLRSAVAAHDVVARLGGDEFAVIVRRTGERSTVEAIASRIQSALSLPIPYDDKQLQVSASIGIAIGKAGYRSTDEIVRDADTAMYTSKAEGRACYTVFAGLPNLVPEGSMPTVYTPIDSDVVHDAETR